MSNLTPFEIRLELLKMAKDMLVDEFYTQKDKINQEWQMQLETARTKGESFPPHPPLPSFPNEGDVIDKATTLNTFVSQITPQVTTKAKK
jgi:hypothetical protein